MNPPDIQAALNPVIDAFEALGIVYYVGGSVVSSVYGIPRTTVDIDLVADLQRAKVNSLCKLLQETYYIDASVIEQAIQRRSSFNLIHLPTMIKIDVFAVKSRSFDQESFRRMRRERLEDSVKGREYYLASPEDIILNKLEWYRQGGEISERQWTDVLGVLKVQSKSLDRAYLLRWAVQLGVEDLLKRSLEDAGLENYESA
jgi:hypothetical protein